LWTAPASLAECEEISMSSSYFASNPTRLAAEGSGLDRADSSAEERVFARRVRSPGWQSALPLLTSTLFGLALVATAVAAPAPPTVRHMLAADGERAAAEVAALTVGANYSLPVHWLPSAPSPEAPDGPLACDPASNAFVC
jgi:hypothetical protein